jgi:diguanylate cyclase (GGDEF)-like protein
VTALAVPVRARGRLDGVLSLYRGSGAPFGDDELDDTVGLARQAGAAIDTTYLHDEARRLSLTDGLTSLWNRRQFELRAAQELERAVRFRERFSVVIVDLDDFKRVNDSHGHLVGDAVLIETAQRLVAATREVDTVARFGGEEFVLLLPQTDALGAVRVAEKVREEVAAKPVETDAGALPVTLSAGVACHPDDGTSI